MNKKMSLQQLNGYTNGHSDYPKKHKSKIKELEEMRTQIEELISEEKGKKSIKKITKAEEYTVERKSPLEIVKLPPLSRPFLNDYEMFFVTPFAK